MIAFMVTEFGLVGFWYIISVIMQQTSRAHIRFVSLFFFFEHYVVISRPYKQDYPCSAIFFNPQVNIDQQNAA